MSTIPIAPARTHRQRLDALAEANRIRTYRKEIKEKIVACEITIFDLRHDPDMQSAKVLEFLLVEPKIGKVRANRIIQRAQMSASKTFGGITDRQWAALAAAFRASPAGALTIQRKAAA